MCVCWFVMKVRLLMIDTCGLVPAVGLADGEATAGVRLLGQKSASAEIVNAMRRLLSEAGWSIAELTAVGVVNGPGSFTGVRTGLAAAKGLCEAAGLPLIAVSRLEVLAEASGLAAGLAVLDAGRGELYVRDIGSGREWLCGADVLEKQILLEKEHRKGMSQEESNCLVAGDAKSAERLAANRPLLRPLVVDDALPVMLRSLERGPADGAIVEGNYVRQEQDIYPTGSPR
jgi:tRNA threonylcarbamoyladenosine biosynthesis protein TsaB